MKSAFDFLREDLYLPGYMTLLSGDYQKDSGSFGFQPIEPTVTRIELGYLTPRGLHVTLSQAGVCLVERIAAARGIIESGEFRTLTGQGRLKIIELNQKFRREVPLKEALEAKMTLTKLRPGKLPVVQLEFDIDNKAIKGEITGVIAPTPQTQTNQEILRN